MIGPRPPSPPLHLLSQVEEEYIQDDFNLSGLSSQVPYYDYALDLILDVESPSDDLLTEEQHEMVESAAEMLYGLIHLRYILTSRGLAAMLEKFKNVEFGRCPRVYCEGQPCLPVGQSDLPRTSTVKIHCPKARDETRPSSLLPPAPPSAAFPPPTPPASEWRASRGPLNATLSSQSAVRGHLLPAVKVPGEHRRGLLRHHFPPPLPHDLPLPEGYFRY